VKPGAQPYVGCENALRQVEQLRCKTLTIGYEKNVPDGWRAGGCMDESSGASVTASAWLNRRRRKLWRKPAPCGSRLRSPAKASATCTTSVLEIVLRPRGGGKPVHVPTDEDARRWMTGRVTTVRLDAALPESLVPGDYGLLLALPDAAPALRGRAACAVRFANEGAWEPLPVSTASGTSSACAERPHPAPRRPHSSALEMP
jgi:hypothetical protein